MTRALHQRIERLEKVRAHPERPRAIFSACPLPEQNPSDETIDRWLASGEAHVSFGGHAIFYDGGRGKLTREQWLAEYSIGTAKLPKC